MTKSFDALDLSDRVYPAGIVRTGPNHLTISSYKGAYHGKRGNARFDVPSFRVVEKGSNKREVTD